MKALRYFRVATDSVMAHKMRAVLTMLGIIIGVAAVLTTLGFGSGAAADITENIESNGTNLLTVSAGARGGSNSTLTLADAEALEDTAVFASISLVAPQYSSSTTITQSGTEGEYQVVGTTPSYAVMSNFEFSSGQFFTEEQRKENSSVVVLGATVAEDLFAGYDPIGETVRIDNNIFEVIGVLSETGGSGFGSVDSQTFVPLEVALGRLFNVARYRGSYTISSIIVQVADREEIDATEMQIEQSLRMYHNLGDDDDNDFMIRNQADMLEMVGEVTGTLTVLLGSIGAVSLLVGGIGIMNIMLVSVTERTREIGLRKAIGAHNSDILLQFLIEALVLCVAGGLIGIGLSYALSFIFGVIPAMPFSIVIEPWSLALAMGVSSASGFVFGLYPAMRATQLDPIEALRYE